MAAHKAVEPGYKDISLKSKIDVYNLDKIYLFEVPCKAITSIIFGARISAADRKTLMKCRETSGFDHMRFTQAILSPHRSKLDFNPVLVEKEHSSKIQPSKSKKFRSQ